MSNEWDELAIEASERPRLVRSEESVHAWHRAAIGFKAAGQATIDNFIDESHVRSSFGPICMNFRSISL